MADKITFDFENNEVIFDTDLQQGVFYDSELKVKKYSIMAAAGYFPQSFVKYAEAINKALTIELPFNYSDLEE